MMAYFAMAECWGCHKVFAFNPHLVPSVRDQNGTRHPVCGECMFRANAIRTALGNAPHPIQPGAYDVVGEATDDDLSSEDN